MEKEGKINLKFLFAGLFLIILMMVFVFALTIELTKPEDLEINISTSRNINFTFNATWSATGEIVANCSLWTNFTGNWVKTKDNISDSARIMNGSQGTSNINYTFAGDVGLMVWAIGCYNATGNTAILTFNENNRTLAIDTAAPVVIQTAEMFSGFNTTDETPDIKINFTDINGTGVNMSDQLAFNISLYNYPDTTAVLSYNITSGSLTCIPTGEAMQSTQCTLNIAPSALTNGTKNISIAVTDRAGHTNVTQFKFTVDQIPPVVGYYNFTNASSYNTTGEDGTHVNAIQLGTSAGTSRAQGDANTGIIYVAVNWTDNLTQPLRGLLQFYNVSKPSGQRWQTLNESPAAYLAYNNASWTNFSYPILKGHNEFEGTNVSFRVIANDTLGNVNDSMSVKNFTIRINDTTTPTIAINGTFTVNGTNISDTTPRISWVVVEGTKLRSINVSLDRRNTAGQGVESGCNKYAFFTTSGDTNDVELFRNSSFQIKDDATCRLTNGSHYIIIIAIDSAGNSRTLSHNFTIETAIPTITLTSLENGLSNTNNSNVTPNTGINFTAVNGGSSKMRNFSWVSSCNDTAQVISSSSGEFPVANWSFIYPFNLSRCPDISSKEGSQTVTITVADDAGNIKTELWQFMVDDLAPNLTVTLPVDGARYTNNVSINLSAIDGTQKISRFGYYLDEKAFASLNSSSGIGTAANNASNDFSRNFTPGRHTIKFTASDALGTVTNNTVNSSSITITVLGPINFTALNLNTTLRTYNVNKISSLNLTNASGTPIYEIVRTVTDQTLNLFMALNYTAKGVNITIYFNASAANWDRYNFSVLQNHSTSMGHMENNWTAVIFDYLYINSSLANFIPDNNHYAKVKIPMNASLHSLGGTFELWYFADETDLTTRTRNMGACSATFSPTLTTSFTACWNNTDNKSVYVFAPNLGIVALVNNSVAPTINVTIPQSANQTVSTFTPTITVSSDASTCTYSLNGTGTTTSMTKSGTTCTGLSSISLKNLVKLNGGYNFTFNVTDEGGNTNTYIWKFNVTDHTAPNSGTSISASGSTTGATITITGVNESVNATVAYQSTGNTSFTATTATASETDFSQTQTVTISLSTVSTATLYYYNVTLCDYNANCYQNTTVFTFTQTATGAAAAAAAAGGGGGGGAVPSTNLQASKSQMWSSVSSGSSLALAVDKTDIAITEVSVSEVANELSNVELKASSLKDNPVTEAAAEKVHQYLQITKKNIKDEDAIGIKIKFRVTKTWLTDNGLTQDNVALWRYKDNKWNVLDTTVASSDATYVYYESSTPGFSYFAIGSKAAPPEEVPEEVPEEEVAPPEEEVPEEVPTELPPIEKAKMPVAWIIFAVIIVIGLIAYFVVVKKKKE